MNIITKLAVKWLTRQLRKDKSFYNVYKSNIAMAFYDECKKRKLCKNYTLLHRVANKAADNFMQMWIRK